MTQLFPVAVSSDVLPAAGDRPVVFHGVNKSGSLVMSDVVRDAYAAAGHADRFFSTYHKYPGGFEPFFRRLRAHRGDGFFVSHYIYGGVELPPDALLVTQVRHPLPRTLSVHGWLKRNHIRRNGTEEGFPDLETWVRGLRGRGHTQMLQLALGFPPGWTSDDPEEKAAARRTRRDQQEAHTPEDLRELALENLDRDFAWFGTAEYFEESIFAMAHVCGLRAVPAWQRDTRNKWRQRLADTEPRVIELIREELADEFRFYEGALARFRARTRAIDFGPSLDPYKRRCEGEYGDRIIGDAR